MPRSRRRILLPVALALVLVLLGVGAVLGDLVARERLRVALMQDPAFQSIVLYDTPISPTPNGRIGFRFYGPGAEVLASADISLNQLGMFGNTTPKPDSDQIFSIVVLGGEQSASSVVDVSWPQYLSEMLQAEGMNVQVINCAWPDAGPLTYSDIWNGLWGGGSWNFPKCSDFDPDLVLINFVDTDCYRTSESASGARLFFKGQEVGSQDRVNFKIGEFDLNLLFTGAVAPKNLSSDRAIASRPFGVFGPTSSLDDREAIAELQSELVDQMVDGTNVSPVDLVALLLGEKRNELADRQFEVIGGNIDEAAIIESCRQAFEQLRAIPNAVFLRSFNFPQLQGNCLMELTDKLARIDKDFKFIDLCSRARHWQASATERFMVPFMSEKFTEDGMKAYAKLVAEALRAESTLRQELQQSRKSVIQ